MGALVSTVLGRLGQLIGQKECRILILGLDNAGKTTILYRLHLDDVVQTIPTIGFNVETTKYRNIKFQVWDLGGQTSIRPYWRYYYHNTGALIFVVDAADPERYKDAKRELHMMLEEEELRDVTLIVFANKSDLVPETALAEISEALELAKIKNRSWSIFLTSALKGTGIFDGLDWLVNVLSQK